MTVYKDIDSLIVELSKKFSFIDEKKFFELKDQAFSSISHEVINDDSYLYFKRAFVRVLLEYSKTLFESDDEEIRKNAINKYIDSNYTKSIIPSENLSFLKMLGSVFSSMNITPTEKHFSIIFNNQLFSNILEKIFNCYSNIIKEHGVEKLIDGDSFENARIILKAYCDSVKKIIDKNEERRETMAKEKVVTKNRGKKKIEDLKIYFKEMGYSDEQYNSMYSRLPDEYLSIINSRFTKDGVKDWESKQQQTYFNAVMIPYMKRMIDEPTYTPKVRKNKEKKNNENNQQRKINSETNETKASTISEEKSNAIYDYFDEELYESDKWSYDMITLPDFESFLRTRSIKDIVIAGLRYGGINGKQYSFEEIARFFRKTLDDVKACMAEVILGYETFVSDIMEDLVRFSNMDIAGKKIEIPSNKSRDVVLDYCEYLKNEPLKWIAVVGLNLGYVTGNSIETSDIADFLGFDQAEVIQITRNSLVGYKKHNEKVINSAINALNIDSIDDKGALHMQKSIGKKD